jgi:hypothetical protein
VSVDGADDAVLLLDGVLLPVVPVAGLRLQRFKPPR